MTLATPLDLDLEKERVLGLDLEVVFDLELDLEKERVLQLDLEVVP